MAWSQMSDIYEAKAGYGQRNGSLTVNPGSPLSFKNTASGFNENYGFGTNSTILSYPPVTGNNTANRPGQGPTNAISGQYSFVPSGRFDDHVYYSQSGTRPPSTTAGLPL